jgi:hypothetical protein
MHDDGAKPGTYELRMDGGIYVKCVPIDGGGWRHVMTLAPDELRQTEFAMSKLPSDVAQKLMLYMDLAQRLPLIAAYRLTVQSILNEVELAAIDF